MFFFLEKNLDSNFVVIDFESLFGVSNLKRQEMVNTLRVSGNGDLSRMN